MLVCAESMTLFPFLERIAAATAATGAIGEMNTGDKTGIMPFKEFLVAIIGFL